MDLWGVSGYGNKMHCLDKASSPKRMFCLQLEQSEMNCFPAYVLKHLDSCKQLTSVRGLENLTHHHWRGSWPVPGRSYTFLLEWLGQVPCTEQPCQHRSPRNCNEIQKIQGKTCQHKSFKWMSFAQDLGTTASGMGMGFLNAKSLSLSNANLWHSPKHCQWLLLPSGPQLWSTAALWLGQCPDPPSVQWTFATHFCTSRQPLSTIMKVVSWLPASSLQDECTCIWPLLRSVAVPQEEAGSWLSPVYPFQAICTQECLLQAQ